MRNRDYRLTPSQVEILRRDHELIMAWRADKPVVVDGIVFDLRCDVDKERWSPLSYLGFHSYQAARQGPELVFPWTPLEQRSYIEKAGPFVVVAKGSIVTLGGVEDRTFRSAFADFAESEQVHAKAATVLVVTPDKEVLEAKRPLIMLTEAATEPLIDYEEYDAAYRGLIRRLERLSGLDDLEDLIEEPITQWPARPRTMPPIYAKAFYTLIQAKKEMAVDSEAAFVAFGYLMAKAEAQQQLLDVATRGRTAIASQESAVKARKAANRPIKDRILAEAKLVIAREPEISLTRCSQLIAEALAADPTWRRGKDHKWIVRHIRDALFESRGTSAEYRPKRSGDPQGTTSG